MFVLELAFTDEPARHEARPAHREVMQRLRAEGKVLAGGPWADDTGAMIVFLVDTIEEARAIIQADPYFSTPGVGVVALHDWNAVTRHEAIADL